MVCFAPTGCSNSAPSATESQSLPTTGNTGRDGDTPATPGASKEQLAKVSRGMTRAEVVQLLGVPEKDWKLPGDRSVLAWETKGVHVYLDGDARVLSTVSPWEEQFGSLAGQVSLDGRPLSEGGRLSFHPARGETVVADVDAEGNYSAKKLPVGLARVTVEFKGRAKEHADPKLYSDPVKTPLVVLVESGETKYDLQLRGR